MALTCTCATNPLVDTNLCIIDSTNVGVSGASLRCVCLPVVPVLVRSCSAADERGPGAGGSDDGSAGTAAPRRRTSSPVSTTDRATPTCGATTGCAAMVSSTSWDVPNRERHGSLDAPPRTDVSSRARTVARECDRRLGSSHSVLKKPCGFIDVALTARTRREPNAGARSIGLSVRASTVEGGMQFTVEHHGPVSQVTAWRHQAIFCRNPSTCRAPAGGQSNWLRMLGVAGALSAMCCRWQTLGRYGDPRYAAATMVDDGGCLGAMHGHELVWIATVSEQVVSRGTVAALNNQSASLNCRAV